MYSILVKLFTLFSLLVLASASPLSARQVAGGQCNTGAIQCCQQVQTAGSPDMTNLLGLLGIVVDGLNVPIGLQCSPLTVGGLGNGATCSAQPVCCSDNSSGGLVSVGCIPITLEW
ncbi:fungal hydrophobin [Gloeophyllum trabeum ATCC 11539]|uniref:Hydrophobin n=1 Tax=Gloeophyllum trabeum (strain ATCC 11539 / FP-39264 / Madison 617) TaxID=670483 RepID=S7RKB1_GLOTA|nr:fungal hydrophobin [Gloeophyllum trabeum ATCC 11539]EPQ53084.1 fungal hydrophobin [Gloeophyllum trabeum ATCC 11539]